VFDVDSIVSQLSLIAIVCHLLIHADSATILLTGDECKHIEALLPKLDFVLDGNKHDPFNKMFKAYQELSLQIQSLEPFTDDDIKKLEKDWVAFALSTSSICRQSGI
jgi:hypothetical protein